MSTINEVTNLEVTDSVAVITLNSPPVNALSANVREGLNNGVEAAIKDNAVNSIVIICDGGHLLQVLILLSLVKLLKAHLFMMCKI